MSSRFRERPCLITWGGDWGGDWGGHPELTPDLDINVYTFLHSVLIHTWTHMGMCTHKLNTNQTLQCVWGVSGRVCSSFIPWHHCILDSENHCACPPATRLYRALPGPSQLKLEPAVVMEISVFIVHAKILLLSKYNGLIIKKRQYFLTAYEHQIRASLDWTVYNVWF